MGSCAGDRSPGGGCEELGGEQTGDGRHRGAAVAARGGAVTTATGEGRATRRLPPRRPTLFVSREGSRHATWLELFFDLVFVLAIAELAHLLHDDPTPGA